MIDGATSSIANDFQISFDGLLVVAVDESYPEIDRAFRGQVVHWEV